MFEYSSVRPEDLPAMIGLYHTYLNGGDGVVRFLEEGMSAPGYAGVKCTLDGRMIGVFSARPGIEFTCGHAELVELIEREYGNEDIYTADMLAVEDAYRGRGIARQLSIGLRDALMAKGALRLIIEEWHRAVEDDMPVSGVVRYFGKHRVIGDYPDFYRDLEQYDMTCPECVGPCRCGAKVIVIRLSNENFPSREARGENL